MADRIRAFDWSASPVGAPETWPQSLRTAITLCLTSNYPMYVWWGPELVAFYNDAYVPIAGSLKHPRSLGRPAREMWPEIWDIFSGFVDDVRRTGRSIWRDNMPLLLERSGVVEEAYFTFSFGPAHDEQGEVAGVVCTCNETTTTIAREAHFRDIVDTSPSMLWITNPEGLATYLSRQWFEFTGRTPEQDLGHGWLENVHPDDRGRSAEQFALANARREAFHFDYRLRSRDGTYRWAMDSGFPRVSSTGEFLGFIGTVIDIHERKTLEARFRSVAESIGLGVWYCDLPFAELIWDRTVKEHFFLPPTARVTIDTFYERIHPADRERTRRAIDHSIAHHAAYDIDYRTTNPADERQVKNIRAIGWTDYDQSGKPIRFDGVTLDVTDEKRSHRLLRESQLRYELATRATKNAIWDWDLATNIIAWNEAIHTEYGHPRRDGQSSAAWWYENIHPDDRERVVHGIHVAIETTGQELWFEEYRYLRADGSYAAVLDRGYILRDEEGRAHRMIGAMEDMTSRKRAEENLRAAVRVRDEFLSIASHELKTPLTSLKLQADLASRTLRGDDIAVAHERARRFVDQAHKQIGRLSRLVDDMLDISRLATGKLTLEREPVDLALVAAELVEQFRPQFEALGTRLELSAEGSAIVHADRARIEQVLVNLLTNALKYGDAKPVRVTVVARGDRVRMEVVDEGIGISSEHQARVFDRFERAVPATAISGLGLGLYISKQIVEMHEGHIELASQPGRGSTFTVDLPVAPA